MCEFCNNYHSSNGGTSGKDIKIKKCANETDLTDCTIVTPSTDSPGIIIFSIGIAKGFIDINFCPICGRDLRSGIDDKN